MIKEDNKRIAKNTLFLYIRMGIIMIVKLYTSRVLLEVLGIDDYGIWNAIAAFVIAFSFISSPLVTATQRFLNYDMGKGSHRLNELFVTSLILFIGISIIVIIALETGGIWFLNHKMNFNLNIPNILISVNILFQLSVVTLVLNILRLPYESTIIAEERMSFYAIICVIESILMLSIAFVIKYNFGYNKLIVYGFLNLVLTGIVTLVYKIYSNKNFNYSKIKKITFDKNLVKEVVAFSGWNLFGACASMTATQGISTLINIFFGVTLNATYGIAIQVQGAVRNVVQNFQKASNPQIVKSFSGNNISRTHFLVINVCKFSYLLSLLFALPMIFNIDYILYLWLGTNIPPMTNVFSCLILILILLVSFSGPMDTAILSTGKIKAFQITYSIIIFSNIIITYILFSLGAPAFSAIITKCIIELIIIIIRVLFLKHQIHLKIAEVFRSTFFPCIIITICSASSLYLFCTYTSFEGWQRLLLSSSIFIVTYMFSLWWFALNQNQRNQAKVYILDRFNFFEKF